VTGRRFAAAAEPAGACLALAVLAAASGAHAQPTPAPAGKPTPAAKPAAATVDAVTVTGEAAQIVSSIDRRSYSLGKDIAATSGSVADALRSVPSLEVDLNGAVTMRGDANVTILIDGKPSAAFEGQNRAEVLSQMPADQIERVEVITNPSAAMNPEGSGGVINLVTKKSRGAGLTGSAYVTAGSAGSKRSGVTFGYNTGKLSLTGSVAGNYQHAKSYGHELRSLPDQTGVFRDHLLETIGRNLTRGPTARLTAGYALTPKDQLTLNYSYNHLLWYGYPYNHYVDDLGGGVTNVQDRQSYRRLAQNDTGVSAGWRHSFAGDGHQLSVDLIQNRVIYGDWMHWNTFNASPPIALPYELDTRNVRQEHSELRTAYTRPLADGAKLALGYELKYDDNHYGFGTALRALDYAADTDPALTSDFLYKQTINAGYATYEKAFGDFSLQAGLRLEDTQLDLDERNTAQVNNIDYFRAYPTIHLSYRLDDTSKVTASYSKRIQRPSPIMLDPFRIYGDGKNFQQGNPQLRPQETNSFELAYEKRKGATYYLATAFYRRNEKEFAPLIRDVGDGGFLQTYANLGSSRSAGLELTANGALSKTLAYTASSSLYWSQIDASNLGFFGDRSAYGVNARVNLNWQARPNDLVQVNVIASGKRLYPQGFNQPTQVVNLGWRHKINDRVTATISAVDVLKTARNRLVLDSPSIKDHAVNHQISRAISLRLDYRFGGAAKAPARAPGFEYENPAPAPAAP
jgi:outer membrane receptor protein involved in Fe transport